jgi:hypothetical protein
MICQVQGNRWLDHQERDLKHFLFHEVLLRWGKVQACHDVVVPGNLLTDVDRQQPLPGRVKYNWTTLLDNLPDHLSARRNAVMISESLT